MALTVGELNAVLTVNDTGFGKTLDEAKRTMEKVALTGEDMGEEIEEAFKDGTKASQKYQKEVKDTRTEQDKAGKSASAFGKKIATAFKTAAVIAVGKQMVDLTKNMANLALEAQESAAAFEITFGGSVQQVSRFVNDMSHAFGLTRAEMQQLMAVTGSVIQGLGLNSDVAAEMSTRILELSGDLAAFMNIQEGASVPANAMRKALTGEFESLKSLGIVLRQAEIETRALAMTNKQSVKDLTQAEKATVSLMLIEEKMGHIKGQLGREAKGAANQIRSLRAEFREMQTEVGAAVLPAVAELIPFVREMMPAFKGVSQVIADVVVALAKGLMPAFKSLGNIITAVQPIVDVLAQVVGTQLKLAFDAVGIVIDTFILPILNVLSDAIEGVANLFGILTNRQKDFLLGAETGAGIVYRMNDAIAKGVPPQEAYNIALEEANTLGIDQSDIIDDLTQGAFNFSKARQDEIKAQMNSIRQMQDYTSASQKGAYVSGIYVKGVDHQEEALTKLEQELIANQYAQYAYARSQANTVNSTQEETDAIDENTEALEENKLELDANTQAKLANLNMQNETLMAVQQFISASMAVNEILNAETVAQEKLNKLIGERTKLQTILNQERGKGEEQTEVELAQIAKLQAKERDLLSQQQKGVDLKLEIASAELDLADAIMERDEKGEEADARDDLRIKQQELRLKDLQAQQANGKDVTIELAGVQEQLANAIAQSTEATQDYITAERQMKALQAEIKKAEADVSDARISNSENQMELAMARMNLEMATATVTDKNLLQQAKLTLARILNLSSTEANQFLKDLGIDEGAIRAMVNTAPTRKVEFDPETQQALLEDQKNTKKEDTEDQTDTTLPNLVDFAQGNNRFGGGISLANAGFGQSVRFDDSSFDLGDPNSIASQFLKSRNNEPTVIVQVDSAIADEIKIEKQLKQINDRLQLGARFSVL